MIIPGIIAGFENFIDINDYLVVSHSFNGTDGSTPNLIDDAGIDWKVTSGSPVLTNQAPYSGNASLTNSGVLANSTFLTHDPLGDQYRADIDISGGVDFCFEVFVRVENIDFSSTALPFTILNISGQGLKVFASNSANGNCDISFVWSGATGTNSSSVTNTSISNSGWAKLAASRSGSVLRFFLDDVLIEGISITHEPILDEFRVYTSIDKSYTQSMAFRVDNLKLYIGIPVY